MDENTVTWAQRVQELHSSGLSLIGMRAKTGLAVSTLSDIKQGRTREPIGMGAVRLYLLHEEHTRAQQKRKAKKR